MTKPSRNGFRNFRQLALVGSLTFATFVCFGLFTLRVAHSHSVTYRYLIWNLFLAWLPILSALAAYNLQRRHRWANWILIPACALFWLVFFPNSPYLITDIMHLQRQTAAPFWYDLILFVAFAWTGFFLGLVSLFLMQEIVRRAAGNPASWFFALGVLALSSFGIYLGRFLRWNSWDVFLNPGRLFADVAEQVQDPFTRLQAFVFSALFACFFLTMYLTLVAVTHFQGEMREGNKMSGHSKALNGLREGGGNMMSVLQKSYDEIVDLFARASSAEVLAFRPSADSQERVRYLLEQNEGGDLTEDETAELERFGELEHLMQLVKARAQLYLESPSRLQP